MDPVEANIKQLSDLKLKKEREDIEAKEPKGWFKVNKRY
jgi:hypothetical protein